MKKHQLFIGMALCVSTLFSGCATTRDVNQVASRANDVAKDRMQAAREPQMSNSTFVVNNGFYASRSPIDTPAPNLRERLPAAFKKEASLQRMGTSLSDVASHITRVSGYRVALAPELQGATAGVIEEVDYKGDMEGLLDYLSGSLGLSWKYDGQKIEIFRFDTKMFRINALAGRTSMSASLDTTSSSASEGGSGNTGDSGQTTSIESEFDIWADVSAAIKALLSTGGTMNVAPSGGVVTVRDTPSVLRQVESHIREFNRLYSRQVMINVEVYSVERSAEDSVATDWTVAWQQAAGKFGLGFSTNGAGASGTTSAPLMSGVVNTGPFAGSGLVVQALSSLGRTQLLTSGSVSTLNGQTAPLNVSREQSYLESYATTIAGGGAGGVANTTLTAGVVTDGFSMNVTPRLLEDNRVMLRFAVDLSSTDGIDTFETPDGNSAIQLPRRSVRNFLQHVSLRSGQTLVLTGFQQSQTGTSQSGPLSPKAWFFGGKTGATATTRTIVIIATPYITE